MKFPNLTEVFLSGNGLDGKLPDIPADSKLRKISVPYNRLSGTIPFSISTSNELRYLALSNNHLSGTIENMHVLTSVNNPGSVDADMYLGLHTNRLSGDIPKSLRDVPHINILDGNMFQCEVEADSLPLNDPNYHMYMCGSTLLNSSVYFLIAVSLFVIMFQSYLVLNTSRTYTSSYSLANLQGDMVSLWDYCVSVVRYVCAEEDAPSWFNLLLDEVKNKRSQETAASQTDNVIDST